MSTDSFLEVASKEATYSTAFIAMPVAGLAVVIFEFFQTLELESKYIWTSPWHSVKWLYYLNRVAPVCLLISALCYALVESPSLWTCKSINICMCTFIGSCHLVSEMILYLRVWGYLRTESQTGCIPHWKSYRDAGVVCISLYLSAGEWGPMTTIGSGCITHSRGTKDYLITLVFALLLYSGLTVMVLCVYFGVRYYRASKPGPLLVVFYRDGTLYFVVVVAMSVTNAIIALFIPRFSRFVITIPYSMIMTVICSRMVLHLRQIAHRTENQSFGNSDLHSSNTERPATLAWGSKVARNYTQ
ncbi:hypothetical protein BKA70DRAFT_1579324 [Coprinopsis sp. MPI-PUGE-AT-0042]|nr:hypothetical protein BKA70DRAFT_1579324 [Coprinopsis sp. MPI-PUGE-AT-0042]